jgi:hypothetical protein
MPGRATNDPSNYIAIGRQSAKDTEATTFYFLKHLDGSGFTPEPEVESLREGGDGQEVGVRWRKLVKADGQLVALARTEFTGNILAGVLGAQALTATAAGPLADITISPAATLPYHTVDQAWADEQERNTNVVIGNVDIEFEAGMPLRITAGMVGGGTAYRPTQLLSPTRETVRPFLYPGASIVIAGASSAKVTKGKISIKRGLDDTIQTTGLSREDVVPLNQDYDVDLTLKYEDAVLYRRAHYGGGTTIARDLATIGLELFTQQGSHSLRLALPMLEIVGAQVNRLDPDGKTIFADVAAQTVKSATSPMFAVIRRTGTTTFG